MASIELIMVLSVNIFVPTPMGDFCLVAAIVRAKVSLFSRLWSLSLDQESRIAAVDRCEKGDRLEVCPLGIPWRGCGQGVGGVIVTRII